MTTSRVLSVGVAVVVLATPAAAGADHAVDDGKVVFEAKPVLVATSSGAYVDYVLNRNANRHAITIDGRRARLFVDKTQGAGHYRGLIDAGGLEKGETYTVKIVITRPGKDVVRVDRLGVRAKSPRSF